MNNFLSANIYGGADTNNEFLGEIGAELCRGRWKLLFP